MRTLTKELQQSMTPQHALETLVEGNMRFAQNLRFDRNLLQQAKETADGQFPFAIVLSCIDSRTAPELIFNQGLGDIFSVRVAGNVLSEDVLGCMEFACQVAGSKLIVVLGHTRCGAVKGACDRVRLGSLTALLNKIQPAVYAVEKNSAKDLPFAALVDRVAMENTRQQLRGILERSPILEHLYNDRKIGMAGGMYSVETGEVAFFERNVHAGD